MKRTMFQLYLQNCDEAIELYNSNFASKKQPKPLIQQAISRKQK